MAIDYIYPEFEVKRNLEKCTHCLICINECSNKFHSYNKEKNLFIENDEKCVSCLRCVAFCPTHALKIVKNDSGFKSNYNWDDDTIKAVIRQSSTGGILLSSMGSPVKKKIYWDSIVINASQVTNPSIDPLREPMETRVFLGSKDQSIERDDRGKIIKKKRPQLILETPIMFSAMSYGSISYNAHKALAMASKELGTFYNTGEGGLHEDFYSYGDNTIVQIASGRFGVKSDYLKVGKAIEIKIGQGAKPGIGGHLPGSKIVGDISRTRMIKENSDAISPAPHHDIYSIEDLSQLVYSLKEVTHYQKPIIVKVAAVNNIASIASGIARSGADIIALDGFRGGTGASPTVIRDNVGLPIELALATVDERLREEAIRDKVSLVVSGSIRNSADIVKAIALGADSVYVATSLLIAMGCHMCRSCHTGRCNWGIATQDENLVSRLDPYIAKERIVNLITAWTNEIKEMLGGMGINSIEALRGNRAMLRGLALNENELKVLGLKGAGEW